MQDITSILMGDPGSTCRRPPTAAEIERMGRLFGANSERHRPRRQPYDMRLASLAVGHELVGLTKEQARKAAGWLYRNLKSASVKRMTNGQYRLRRVA